MDLVYIVDFVCQGGPQNEENIRLPRDTCYSREEEQPTDIADFLRSIKADLRECCDEVVVMAKSCVRWHYAIAPYDVRTL
ncbi:MAG: hypothetical protein J1F36_00925 [Clostridiales bacterium]|nr:hypothetical protein [Clostridiales bacterium]